MDVQEPTITAEKQSIKTTHRTDRSLVTAVFQKIIRPIGPRLTKPKKKYPPGSPRLNASAYATKKCEIHERRVDDIWIYDVAAKSSAFPSRGRDGAGDSKSNAYRIYYFAGGGWQSPPSSHHWRVLALLSSHLKDATISVVSYPLAPNSPAPTTFPKLLALYKSILSDSAAANETVTFAGDSAGGNIVLALTIEALRLDADARKPHSLLAICPSVDLSRRNPKIGDVEKHDPFLRVPFVNATAEAWAGEWPEEDPRLSPLLADVGALRRAGVFVDGITGGYDILGPDGVRFRQKCEAEGVEGEWLQWGKQMHCWPLAKTYGLFPESAQAWDWIVRLLKKRSSGAKDEENVADTLFSAM